MGEFLTLGLHLTYGDYLGGVCPTGRIGLDEKGGGA